MLKIKWTIAVATFVFFTACSNQEDQSKTESGEKTQTECIYSLVNDSTAVNWTAFKTSARVGVKGHFDEIKVSTPENAKASKDLLVGTSFDIVTSTVNTGNDERDPKLVKFFFATLKDGANIKGKIKSAEGNENEGKGLVELLFNGITKDINYTYQIKENKIFLKTGINLDEWDGSNAVKSLNTECKDLHAGDDGVSKLWPDIELEVVALVKKDC